MFPSIVADRVTFLGGANAQDSDEVDFNDASNDPINPAKFEAKSDVENEKNIVLENLRLFHLRLQL